RGRGADMHRLIGHLDVQRVAIGVGIDGNGGDAELLRRFDDPAGDLAAIGDEDFLEHQLPEILSCVFVSKSEASWRSWSCLEGSPKVRLTIEPRWAAGRSPISLRQRWTCSYLSTSRKSPASS